MLGCYVRGVINFKNSLQMGTLANAIPSGQICEDVECRVSRHQRAFSCQSFGVGGTIWSVNLLSGKQVQSVGHALSVKSVFCKQEGRRAMGVEKALRKCLALWADKT